ncbi:hypothetical protein TRSC58_07606 [Trypanosoma rangeli SC58]|uniref:Uncharacterized protein n=1 Tax=Trypanosoma rangeli SC58 TaxID=429131 RepID=A0A061IUW5_TRYRA|nr:hypothetical protein TRSC58_07606 [Trypanosoma rangeli SC58]
MYAFSSLLNLFPYEWPFFFSSSCLLLLLFFFLKIIPPPLFFFPPLWFLTRRLQEMKGRNQCTQKQQGHGNSILRGEAQEQKNK